MLTVTQTAHAQINEILLEEQEAKYVRAFTSGGGCAGFNYGFTLENDTNEDDFVIERPGMRLLIDAMSMQYMMGATIDYKEELMGSSFTIKNPNAQTTCGCGSSFAV